MSIINNILSILEQKGLNQAALCSHLKIGTSTMTTWKKRNTDPPSKYIVPICEFLDVDPYVVLTGAPRSTEQKDDARQQLMNLLDNLETLIGNERAQLVKDTTCNRSEQEKARRQEIRRSVPEESAPCESIEIPFFELPVSAGLGVDLLAQDGASETISVPATPTTRRADFSVLVEGDSMEPMFSDGDIVLVEQEQEVPEGQVGIFAVNGAGYIKKAGRRCLISANDKYDDIPISPDDSVRCFGLVIGKL
ncbi:S24 family peptidase [Ruminococcus champanellensis]